MPRLVRFPNERERCQKVSMKYTNRPPPGTPLDPEDLKKRLDEVLAERKYRAERRKHEKAQQQQDTSEKEKRAAELFTEMPEQTQSSLPLRPGSVFRQDRAEARQRSAQPSLTSSEHFREKNRQLQHIPEVAASQFARTTTTEGSSRNLLHKLSKKAMKFHMDGPNLAPAMAAVVPSETAPGEHIQTLQRTQSAREKEYKRNQFQHPTILESAGEVDEARLARQAHRHTFSAYITTKGFTSDSDTGLQRTQSLSDRRGVVQRNSGNRFQGDSYPVEPQGSSDHYEQAGTLDEHRVDWTQADEMPASPTRVASPTLRRSNSRWKRLSGLSKAPREKEMIETDLAVPEPVLKHSKSSFFSRFKR